MRLITPCGYLAVSVLCLLVVGLLEAACTSGAHGTREADYATTTYEKYLPAAENGDPKAQNLIGFMHFFGEGATVDREYAHFWFHLAADDGFALAQRNLAVMHKLGLGTEKNLNEARRYAVAGGVADLDELTLTMPPTQSNGDLRIDPDRSAGGRVGRTAEQSYATFCAGCHGLNGISAFVASPSFALGERMDKKDHELLHSLRMGKGVMPAWGDIFPEFHLLEILEFVRGLQANYEVGIAHGIRRAPDFYYLFGPMKDDHRAYRSVDGG